jgi:dTDP-glucose 4,6-dehydratase
MRLLITGGAGFMGSNFIRHILTKYPNYTIINLDKLTYSGNLDNLKDVSMRPNYKFVKGDICDPTIVDQLAAEVDVIINYAAETHVDRSIIDPSAFVKTDVIGTYNILEAVKKHRHERFIQISTDEVFGSIESGKFTETSPFEPNSPYAASKAGGDLLCRAYQVTYGTPAIVTHSCNFFGPYHYPEKFIPLAIVNLLQGKKIPVYGDGQQVREWIYTEDHCLAIDKLLHKGKPGEVYNISTGYEKKNIDVVKSLLHYTGRDESNIEYVKDRPGHDRRYALDNAKLTKELDWKPTDIFDRQIEKTVTWFKNNEWWWKAITDGSEYREYYQQQYENR